MIRGEANLLDGHLLACIRVNLDLGGLIELEDGLEFVALMANLIQVDFRVDLGVLVCAIDGICVDVAAIELLEHFEEHLIEYAPVLPIAVRSDITVEDVKKRQAVTVLEDAHDVAHMLVQVDVQVLLVRHYVLLSGSLL